MPLLIAAALLLAAGLALGLVAGWEAPLGEALFRYDPALLNTAQAGIQRHVSPVLWDEAVLPLLEHTTWVVPVALGAALLLAQGLLLLLRRKRSGGAAA